MIDLAYTNWREHSENRGDYRAEFVIIAQFWVNRDYRERVYLAWGVEQLKNGNKPSKVRFDEAVYLMGLPLMDKKLDGGKA